MSTTIRLRIKTWWMLLGIRWRRFKLKRWLKKNKQEYAMRLFLPGVRGRLQDRITPWIKICQERDLIDRSFPLVWNDEYIVMYELTKEDADEFGYFTAIGVYRFDGKPIYIDKRNDPQSVFYLTSIVR